MSNQIATDPEALKKTELAKATIEILSRYGPEIAQVTVEVIRRKRAQSFSPKSRARLVEMRPFLSSEGEM
jgi:hypothetical protein